MTLFGSPFGFEKRDTNSSPTLAWLPLSSTRTKSLRPSAETSISSFACPLIRPRSLDFAPPRALSPLPNPNPINSSPRRNTSLPQLRCNVKFTHRSIKLNHQHLQISPLNYLTRTITLTPSFDSTSHLSARPFTSSLTLATLPCSLAFLRCNINAPSPGHNASLAHSTLRRLALSPLPSSSPNNSSNPSIATSTPCLLSHNSPLHIHAFALRAHIISYSNLHHRQC